MKRKLFRLKVLLLLGFSVSLLSVYPVHAVATPGPSTPAPSQCDSSNGMTFACLGEAVNSAILGDANRTKENLARNTADLTIALLASVSTLISGTDSNPTPNTGYNWPPNPFIEGGGALGLLASGVNSIYKNPPTQMIDKTAFFREALSNNILNPKPAYAQGFGTDLLKGLGFIKLWTLFRNIAYLGVAAALGIFGLMVMFRAKADPRTTITFQMALPRVAMALVLIYFSLPIAGLLMDIGEVGSAIIKGIFCPGCTIDRTIAFADLGKMLSDFTFVGGKLQVKIDDKINWLIETLLSLFALSVVLKLFWTLLSRYVTLIMQAILGPLHMVIGIIPGRDDAAGRWIKEMLVNVLTFPGMLFLINIAYVVLDNSARIPLPTIVIDPAGGANPQQINISGMMALGILSMAPKIPAMLEEMFDVVPGAHTSRAGADPGSMMKGIPLVGKMMG
ncbi:MAG: hypothetical protein AAB486_04245 [Patescibacteria group bacterium]